VARRRRLPWGEALIPLGFAAVGAYWMWEAPSLGFWQGFATQAGFLPFAYGLALLLLSGALLLTLRPAAAAAPEAADPIGKPLLILLIATACVLGIEPAGTGPALFGLLVAIFVGVERLPPLRSVLVAAATTAVLLGVFRAWLNVPLPAGPLGF
jgi:hypothetical protein